MSDKNKINEIPEGFTLQMAIMDALPVIFFTIGISLVALNFKSLIFFIGSFLIITAGLLKVLWKFIIALHKKNIRILNKQLRYLMPTGFLLIILSIFIYPDKSKFDLILPAILKMPQLLCFIITLIGMILMSVFAKVLDKNDAKANWIEQTTNLIAQFCFMLGLIFIYK